MMRIAIGADHRGFEHKEYIKLMLKDYEWIDFGAFDDQRSDYPLFAHAVAQALVNGKVASGILICGSGIGMAITANRYKGVYAGVVWNKEGAQLAKEHDNVNLLVIPSGFVTQADTIILIKSWLKASFLSHEYVLRLQMIDPK